MSNPSNFKNEDNKVLLPFRTPIAQANSASQVPGFLGMEQSLIVTPKYVLISKRIEKMISTFSIFWKCNEVHHLGKSHCSDQSLVDNPILNS